MAWRVYANLNLIRNYDCFDFIQERAQPTFGRIRSNFPTKSFRSKGHGQFIRFGISDALAGYQASTV
ncbi:unnamed protein product [Allacma fusca]|uniref:Uncharacterized protein n=1 Tax=Allacma fusca TaxID=39272 RepID=A0A8J2KVH4_9HEXA|nr:unnamed protein product [Allacma fusca]